MSAVTHLSVFAFLLISSVQETRAQTGQVCVVLMNNNVDEDAGAVVFQIIRKGGSTGSVTVGYTITDVTTEPEDIVGPRTGTLTLGDGVTSGTISVPINDDTLEEDSEQFTLSLDGQVGPESQATALIFDNDVYSTWSTWVVGGVCSVTCGPGSSTDTRTRTCVAVVPPRCVQGFTETRSVACNPGPCPVITQWSEWTNEGTCSTTCGPGAQTQSRTRTCTGLCPTPFVSRETRTVACELCTCPMISQWTAWADEGTCSTTCGPGTKTQARTRTCTQSTCCPATLSLRETRTVACELCTCPMISQWTAWADEGTCSTTCGPGTKTQARTRTCTQSTCCPATLSLRETRTVACELCTCPMISQWTAWADEGTCSTTCGPGTKTQARTRTCTQSTCCPATLSLRETRTVACELCTCPMISQWTAWADEGTCSTTCGPGTKTQARTRTCTQSTCCPATLSLRETRTVACELCTCPMISQWTAWADEGTCSTTCGPGTKTQARTRTCTQSTCCPATLSLRETRTVACELCTCPMISQWTAWADEGTCSTTCGPGTKTQARTRTCTQSTCCPATLSLRETRTVACELCTCPMISQWTAWADEGTCSTTCGPGTKTQGRTRTCTQSTCCPATLSLRETRTVACELCTCPMISQWTAWADEGTCSTTCGPGTKTQGRTRTCTQSTCCPATLSLRETRTVACELCTCPMISQWTAWADEGTCSTTCGPGTKTQGRTRTCTQSTCCPATLSLRETRTVSCELCTCPVIGPWCPWSNVGPCSVTCGCGNQTQARTRVCINTCTPPDCVKREERTVNCTHRPCPTAWAAWNGLSGTRWPTWSALAGNRWQQTRLWNVRTRTRWPQWRTTRQGWNRGWGWNRSNRWPVQRGRGFGSRWFGLRHG